MSELKNLKRYSTYEIIEAGVHTMFHICSDVEAMLIELEAEVKRLKELLSKEPYDRNNDPF